MLEGGNILCNMWVTRQLRVVERMIASNAFTLCAVKVSFRVTLAEQLADEKPADRGAR